MVAADGGGTVSTLFHATALMFVAYPAPTNWQEHWGKKMKSKKRQATYSS